MRHDSVEYLHIPITSPTGVDLTGAPIDVSFDGGTTWTAATWTGTEARLLVGPGTTVGALPTGRVSVLVRITDAPERPVLEAGSITVD